MIRSCAFPRAALVGNPSDGFYGRTIAFTFDNFAAQVVIRESDRLIIERSPSANFEFESIDAFAGHCHRDGYYDGERLIRAAIHQFFKYCRGQSIRLHQQNFTIAYATDIPRGVGLAGSSAIITACMRGLMQFYSVDIPKQILVNLVLATENEELGIPGGLQDRVVQVYGGLVYMNFDRHLLDSRGYGDYKEMDYSALQGLYIAYHRQAAECSEVFHDDIRKRFKQNDSAILRAVEHWCQLTEQSRQAIEQANLPLLARCMDKNFDQRAAIYTISANNMAMINTARQFGLSAKFTGSGGAIVGLCLDHSVFTEFKHALHQTGVEVFRPHICAGTTQ